MLETIFTTLHAKASIFSNSIIVADNRTLVVFQYGGIIDHLISSLECLSIFSYEDKLLKDKIKKLTWLSSPRTVQIVFMYSTMEERSVCEDIQSRIGVKKAMFVATTDDSKNGDTVMLLPYAGLGQDVFFTPLPKAVGEPSVFPFDSRSLPQSEILEDVFHKYIPQRTLAGLLHASSSLASLLADADLPVSSIYCYGVTSKVLGKMLEKRITPPPDTSPKTAIIIVDRILDIGTPLIMSEANKVKDLLMLSRERGGAGIHPSVVDSNNLSDILQVKTQSIKALSALRDPSVSQLLTKAVTSTERLIELASTVCKKSSSTIGVFDNHLALALEALSANPQAQQTDGSPLFKRRGSVEPAVIDTPICLRNLLQNMKFSLQSKSHKCSATGDLFMTSAINHILIIASETMASVEDPTISTMLQEFELVFAMVTEACLTETTITELTSSIGPVLTKVVSDSEGSLSVELIPKFVNIIMHQVKRLFACRSDQQILSQQLVSPSSKGVLGEIVSTATTEPGLLLTDAIRLQPSQNNSQVQLSGWLGGISNVLLGEASTGETYQNIIIYVLGGITPSEALNLTHQQTAVRVIAGGSDLLTRSSLYDTLFASE
eukprot:TRINITY_DN19956_c0_g1_i1.p1 TRINITY_DN19956_c0_g1~~TRINITY_DN19956_c0_g1_i1.p1  ORF type:complete len:613 (+),score=86.95 TRINITY_DN19956_c0_g1_i1:26-1840(+)